MSIHCARRYAFVKWRIVALSKEPFQVTLCVSKIRKILVNAIAEHVISECQYPCISFLLTHNTVFLKTARLCLNWSTVWLDLRKCWNRQAIWCSNLYKTLPFMIPVL